MSRQIAPFALLTLGCLQRERLLSKAPHTSLRLLQDSLVH